MEDAVEWPERLERLIPEVVRRWEERVCAAVPAAQEQPRALLRDSMPLFLQAIARAMRGQKATDPEQARDVISFEHGRQRALLGEYSLDQVLLEYCLLRKTVLEALEAEAPLPPPVRDVILDSVEAAMREAGAEFAHTRAEALQRADIRKNEFLVTLGHELRSPLAAIVNAQAVLDHVGSQEPRAVKLRAIIALQAMRLSRLVTDLQDVSRIVQGNIELQRRAVDLAALVGDVVETVRPYLEERNQQLTLSLPASAVTVEGDSDRLEQVVANLLTNASRYTDPGGQITVALQAEAGEAVLHVCDTGIGIAPEMLPTLFEMFVQVNPQSSVSRGGLGIGLTVVKRLVDLHGGEVTVHSEGPGRGSEFVVRLPRLL